MLVVDEKAFADLNRREFFCQLDVQVCNWDTICWEIQLLHNERLPENLEDSPLDLETCITRAVYLFKSGWPYDDGDTLYVYDINEEIDMRHGGLYTTWRRWREGEPIVSIGI